MSKAISIISVPTRRLFGPKAAAEYLGIHEQTLKKITDEGELAAKWMRNRKVYTLEELDRYIESLEPYNPGQGGNPDERRFNGRK